ncbi:uncharacterized protein [Battus philenor]|uniref:uncharacterized protein n=1 Tax=Battus philenor TaxID=42288 RepID=UPI0035D10380
MLRNLIILCIVLVVDNTEALVRRDVTQTTQPNILDTIQRNIDQLRICVDQSLARAVSEVNEKQLDPILNVVGEQLNRLSKAYSDLLASNPSKQ